MRDLREDLYHWLSEVQEQKAGLDRLEKAIQVMLEAQRTRFETPLFEAKALAQPTQSVDADTMNAFIQTQMDNDHAWSIDQLVEAAQREGISFGDKSPSRVVNIAIVNLYNKKQVEKSGEGLWRRRDKIYRRRLDGTVDSLDATSPSAQDHPHQ